MSILKYLWNDTNWFPPVSVVTAALSAILIVIWLVMFGAGLANRSFAADAFSKCATACGANGVRKTDPDYRCECNETHRFEGKPSLDLNIRQEGR